MDLDDIAIPAGGRAQPAGYLASPPGQSPVRDAVDMRDYVRILIKRRWVISLTTLVVFATSALLVYSQPKVYRATAKVQVIQPPPVVSMPGTQASPGMMPLPTQAKRVGSYVVAEKASLRIQQDDQQTISPGDIRSGLSVVIEDPDVLAISIEDTDADRAVLIANKLKDTFIDTTADIAKIEAKGAKEFLEAQQELVLRELNRLDGEIRRYKERHNIRDADPKEQFRASLVPDYRMQAEQAALDLQGATAQLAGLRRRLAATEPTRKVTVVDNPTAQGLRAAMLEAEVDLAKAQAQYEESHPLIEALKGNVRRLQAGLEKSEGTQRKVEKEETNPLYEALRARIEDADSGIDALRIRAEQLENLANVKESAGAPAPVPEGGELIRLVNERGITEKLNVAILEQLQGQKLLIAREQGTARELDIATKPSAPIRPQPGRTLTLGAILGVLAGLTLAMLREYADVSVHDPDQLQYRAGISSLGFIPAASNPTIDAKVTAVLPKSPISEGFRMIQANLKFAWLDSPLRTLMVTSAAASEGKSFTATNLAIVYAQTGVRTLIVDCDLRRPTIHRNFGLEHSPGLTDVLAGTVELDDVLHHTEIDNLCVLPSGSLPPNPSALLDSHRMADLIEVLKSRWDMVIFDTPPALAVADALVLSSRLDAVALVVEQGKVNARALKEIRRMVEQARGRIAGAIINKVRRGSGDYYYYQYYYYYYYYSSKDGKRSRGRRRTDEVHDRTPEAAVLPSGNGSAPRGDDEARNA